MCGISSSGAEAMTVHRSKRAKPSLRYQLVNGVKIYPDGREVCDLSSHAGSVEYDNRIEAMGARQDCKCCICRLPLFRDEATFEHEDGRGAGGSRRDDRIEKDGKPYNGVSHYDCNAKRGSKRTPIWHGEL
jgi:hypothetical protein